MKTLCEFKSGNSILAKIIELPGGKYRLLSGAEREDYGLMANAILYGHMIARKTSEVYHMNHYEYYGQHCKKWQYKFRTVPGYSQLVGRAKLVKEF